MILLKTCKYILSIIFVNRFNQLIMAIKNIYYCVKKEKNYYGQNIHVIGNAPTLDFNKLKNNDPKVCVNFSILDDRIFNLQPSFYVLWDPIFNHTQQINGINCEEVNLKISSLFNIIETVDWEMVIFVPIYFNSLKFRNKRIKVIKAPNGPHLKTKNNKTYNNIVCWLYKHNICTPIFITVVGAAIFYVITLGYKKIYLHGIEVDWFKRISLDENNQLIHQDTHFYQEKNISRNLTAEGCTLLEELYNQYLVQLLFRELSIFANYSKVRVWNTSKTSQIECFEKL